jgi:zinc protease
MITQPDRPGRTPGGAALAGIAMALLMYGCGPKVLPPELRNVSRTVWYQLDGEILHAKNGLTILLLPDASTNLVRVDMRYKVGASIEPTGKAGLAHLAEHASFTLLPQGPTGPELKDLLGQLALDYNAYTTAEETHYHATALAKQLKSLIAIEAVRMRASCAQLDDSHLAREREVARNELRQRSSPSDRVIALLYQELYGPAHPYTRGVVGTEAELATITRDDVCAFFAQHYHPSNAILVVSGKFDEDEVIKLVSHYFGALEQRFVPALPTIQPPALRGTRSRHELPVEEATAFIAIPAAPFGDEAVYESFLMSAVTYQVSRALADNDVITDVSFGRVGGPQAPALVVAVSVRDPKRLEGVVDDIFNSRDQLFKEINEDDLTGMRNRRSAQVLLATEAFASRPVHFADYLQYTSYTELIMRDLRIINQVELADLRERASALLRKEQSHVLLVYPGATAAAEETRPIASLDAGIEAPEPWRKRVDPSQAEKPLSLPDVAVRPEIRELVLDNGLRVLMAPSLTYPVIDIRLVTAGGTLHEPANQTGVGYLAAVLQQRSFSRRLTWKEYDALRTVIRMGARISISQTSTNTVFGVTGMATFADGFLWELHLAMIPGSYKAKALREIVEQQRKAQSRSDTRRRRLTQTLLEFLFGPEHPYATRLWQEDSLKRLSVEDLERFRDRHHRIGSATLIATGRFDAAAFEADVRRMFGEMPARVAPDPPAIPPVAPRAAPTYVAMTSEAQAQTSIRIAFATAPGFREQHAGRLVLAEMLRERLTMDLRHEKALSYSVSVDYVQGNVGPGQLFIETAVDPARAGEAFLLMQDTIRHLRETDFAADFVRARRAVVENLLANALSSRSVANSLEFIAAHRLPLDYFERLPERVAALRMDDVRALIAAELGATGAVVLASGQRASVTDMYRAAGIEGYRVLDAD